MRGTRQHGGMSTSRLKSSFNKVIVRRRIASALLKSKIAYKQIHIYTTHRFVFRKPINLLFHWDQLYKTCGTLDILKLSFGNQAVFGDKRYEDALWSQIWNIMKNDGKSNFYKFQSRISTNFQLITRSCILIPINSLQIEKFSHSTFQKICFEASKLFHRLQTHPHVGAGGFGGGFPTPPPSRRKF